MLLFGALVSISLIRKLTRIRCLTILGKHSKASRAKLFFHGYCTVSLVSFFLFLISSIFACIVFKSSFNYGTVYALFTFAFSLPFAIKLPFQAYKNIDFLKTKKPNRRHPKPLLVIILVIAVFSVIATAPLFQIHQRNKFTSENKGKIQKEDRNISKFIKSDIDDQQEKLADPNTGLEIMTKERFEKIKKIAESSEGYIGFILKCSIKSLNELSKLGQEYKKSASEISEISKHDLQYLHEYKKSLEVCKSLANETNKIIMNYREFIGKSIPKTPENIPFTDFDQKTYAALRIKFLDSGSKTITPTTIAYYQTEEEIWDIKISQAVFLIERFNDWKISHDRSILFDKQSDLDELESLQNKHTQAVEKLENFIKKSLNERKERLKNDPDLN